MADQEELLMVQIVATRIRKGKKIPEELFGMIRIVPGALGSDPDRERKAFLGLILGASEEVYGKVKKKGWLSGGRTERKNRCPV